MYNLIYSKKCAKGLFNKHASINRSLIRGNVIEVRISQTERFGLFWDDNGKITWTNVLNCCAMFYNFSVTSITGKH